MKRKCGIVHPTPQHEIRLISSTLPPPPSHQPRPNQPSQAIYHPHLRPLHLSSLDRISNGQEMFIFIHYSHHHCPSNNADSTPQPLCDTWARLISLHIPLSHADYAPLPSAINPSQPPAPLHLHLNGQKYTFHSLLLDYTPPPLISPISNWKG